MAAVPSHLARAVPGHNMGHNVGAPELSYLGVFYSIFACAYTLLIAAGLILFWHNRHGHAIRLRSVPATYAAVLGIYVYAALIFIVYPLNGRYTCGAEFWIMNTVFPFGIALFQALNIRLWSYYEAQNELRTFGRDANLSLLGGAPSLKARFEWRNLDLAEKTYLGILIGGSAQLVLTIVLFVGSRRFNPAYGFFGTVTGPAECRRGFEWIPSVAWQFLWAWVFGPIVLLKIRKIHDVYHWGLQTKLAIVASMPGTPLWLAFLYSNNKTITSINQWWIPAAWFFPGLAMMQAVSIIFPVLGAYQERRYQNRLPRKTYEASLASRDSSDSSNSEALQTLLQTDTQRLLNFAAKKDFSAENILFLRAVLDFKAKWQNAWAQRSGPEPMERSLPFKEAAYLYYTLVNVNTAKFPINIESHVYTMLKDTFAGVSYSAAAKAVNPVAPWEDSDTESLRGMIAESVATTTTANSTDAILPLQRINLADAHKDGHGGPTIRINACKDSDGVPADFSLTVFDDAYASILYLVLTNTWTRYNDATGN